MLPILRRIKSLDGLLFLEHGKFFDEFNKFRQIASCSFLALMAVQ
jgi:hypothetical protein